MAKRITLGISTGDPNGIGLEVALRPFRDKRLFAYFRPVIFGSVELVAAHQEASDLTDVAVRALTEAELAGEGGADPSPDGAVVQVVQVWEQEPTLEFGRVSEEAGRAAQESLERAVAALRAGHVDALVTAPIHKSAMQQAGFGFPGHTEYLEREFGQGEGGQAGSLMLLVGDEGLRVALVTNHLPLREVAAAVTRELVERKIRLLDESLRRDFGLDGPLIAVLGLNPHAGDGGAIGSEEEGVIRPAVEGAKEAGIRALGPFAADGFFGSGRYREFDGILAMYHDQGLVAFKALAFGGGVNFTAGLSAVRTSPDHGTAHEIAGRGEASAASFQEAMFLAREIFLQRAGYDEAHANPIKPFVRDRRSRRDGGSRGGGAAPGGERGGERRKGRKERDASSSPEGEQA